MANLMCKSNVRNLGGHMRAIVLDSDDSSVQRLLLPIRIQFAFFTYPTRASCIQTKVQQSHLGKEVLNLSTDIQSNKQFASAGLRTKSSQ